MALFQGLSGVRIAALLPMILLNAGDHVSAVGPMDIRWCIVRIPSLISLYLEEL